MTNEFNNVSHSFSLRKIPASAEKQNSDLNINSDIDKVKILEFSNFIDEWEQELLFSEEGFFSIKGKDIENKSREFLSELEKIINKKISEIKFINSASKMILSDIKEKKFNSLKFQMELYESEQLYQWELSVIEQGLNSALNRAVLYKSNPDTVNASFNNAVQILDFLALKENWTPKLKKSKLADFESEFYNSIIQAFIIDKDINAVIYFNKYKNKLNKDLIDKFEKQIESLKISIISYNWAKEIYSYNLDDKSLQKELNLINDDKIKSSAKKILCDLKKIEDKNSQQDTDNKNIQNWNKINEILKSEPDKAVLYIDYSLSSDNQKLKKDYIDKMIKVGYITTDKKKFIETFNEFSSDIEKFIKKDISDLQSYFSEEDYRCLRKIISEEKSFILNFISDYKNIKSQIKNDDVISFYEILTLFIRELFSYKATNNKEADVETRNKFIKSALERNSKKDKEHIK